MEQKNNTKKKVLIIASSITLLVLIIGLTYALWTRSYTQTSKNINEYDCFDIEFTDDEEISITNAYPQTIITGLQNKPYTITMNNKCHTSGRYDVLIHVLKTPTLDINNVNIGVDEQAYNLGKAPTVESEKVENAQIVKKITSGMLGENETKELDIRAWMDENTSETDGLNKTISFRVSIENSTSVGNLLAGKIIRKGISKAEPDYTKGEPPATGTNSGPGIYALEDDDGMSYFYRGDIKNNYIKFQNSNIMWRIVRINGDGTIRIITDEKAGQSTFRNSYSRDSSGYTYNNQIPCKIDTPCYSTYDETNNTFVNSNGGLDSNVKTFLENWYITNLKAYNDKIAITRFCNDTTYRTGYEDINEEENVILYYGDKTTTDLKCEDLKEGTDTSYGGNYRLKIGLLAAFEMGVAGIGSSVAATADNYIYHADYWFSMTPNYSFKNYAKILGSHGGASSGSYMDSMKTFDIYPVVNLKSDVEITGTGTIDNPFVVQ